MSKPLLSIGIIFKDDIRCLDRCLRSLEPLRQAIPCQLVMADTGSSDGSREIAARYADLLFDFPWINDFSAARNAVMDRCTGDWYLSIDTDEALANETELVAFLKSKKKNPDAVCGLVTVRNYGSTDMVGDYVDGLAGRLLRMDTGLRFEGAIHEVWPVQDLGYGVADLHSVVLNHDGYIFKSQVDAMAKARRNLDLLAPILEKDPKNCRRMLQCIESAISLPDKRMYYATLGMELIEEDGPEIEQWGPPIIRKAVECAVREGLRHERDNWTKIGFERFPDSPHVQIDLNYSRINICYQRQEYKDALTHAERYLQAIRRYDRSEYSAKDLLTSPVHATTMTCRLWGMVLRADCLCNLERWEDAREALAEPEPEQQNLEQITFWLKDLRQLYEAGYEVAQQVQKLEPLLDSDFSAEPQKHELQKKVKQIAASYFFAPEVEGKRLPYGMFRSFKSNDLGRAVQLMDTTDGETAQQIAAGVQQWASLPVPAMARIIALGKPFPDAFYEMSGELLRTIAAGMANTRENLPQLSLSWAHCDNFKQSIVKFQFLFDFTIAALRTENWKTGVERLPLCRQFLSLATGFLPSYYSSALLNDESAWNALPNLHHFTLLLLRAQAAKDSDDTIGYVQYLHKALNVSPAMKDMVDFLLNDRSKTSTQIQLEQMAEQVRSILAQYPPYDPAIVALKQSEVYQKVAYLIEGPDAHTFGSLPQ